MNAVAHDGYEEEARFWDRIVDEFRAGGITQKALARKHGVGEAAVQEVTEGNAGHRGATDQCRHGGGARNPVGRQVLEVQQAQFDTLKRQLLGKKSEKMPPMDHEVRRGKEPDLEAARRTRRANAEIRAKKLETQTIELPVPHCDRLLPPTVPDGSDALSVRAA